MLARGYAIGKQLIDRGRRGSIALGAPGSKYRCRVTSVGPHPSVRRLAVRWCERWRLRYVSSHPICRLHQGKFPSRIDARPLRAAPHDFLKPAGISCPALLPQPLPPLSSPPSLRPPLPPDATAATRRSRAVLSRSISNMSRRAAAPAATSLGWQTETYRATYRVIRDGQNYSTRASRYRSDCERGGGVFRSRSSSWISINLRRFTGLCRRCQLKRTGRGRYLRTE